MSEAEREMRLMGLVEQLQEIRRSVLVIEGEFVRGGEWKGQKQSIHQAVKEVSEKLYHFDDALRRMMFREF